MSKPNEKKPKDNRKRLEICDWNETLHVTALNKHDHYSAKAKCRGTLTENEIAAQAGLDPTDVEHLLVAVGNAVHEGYDVQLCGGVHFYACVAKLKTAFIAVKTIGNFRRSIADKTFRAVLHGAETAMEKIRALDKKARKDHPHVTPDTMITCPVCGNEIRVGKVLK